MGEKNDETKHQTQAPRTSPEIPTTTPTVLAIAESFLYSSCI